MKHVAAAVFVVLMAGAVAAHAGHFDDTGTEAPASIDDAVDEIDTLAATYNENADSVPSLVESLVADERVNVHIETGDDDIVIGVVMDDARMTTVTRGGVENVTVDLYTDEETVSSILAAEDSPARAVEAFNSDHITYEAHGFGRSIKFAVISTVSKILGFLL